MRYTPAARVDTVIAEALAAVAIDKAKRTARIYHFHTDLVGAPLEVTDESGELAWAGKYSAWGKVEPSARQLTAARTDQPLRYAGRYTDDGTGLHYNTFRFYDPDVGRFINQDPIGLLGGDNLYAYAPNSTGWIDPWGWCITTTVTRGAAGQPLRATATITAKDIGTGTATNASSRAFARLLGRSSDDAGHIFAKLLGGSGGKGNVFPQLSNINRGAFSQFEAQVARQARQLGRVDAEVIFNYANGGTRPTSRLYNVYDSAGNLISQMPFFN